MAAPSPISPRPSYSHSNHIDLTLDDDDDDPHHDQYNPPRYAKRARTESTPQHTAPSPFRDHPTSTVNRPTSPFPNKPPIASSSVPVPYFSQSSFNQLSNYVPSPNQSTYRPLFAGPPPYALQRHQHVPNLPPTGPPFQPFQQPPPPPQQSLDRQVIDLTGSPSPPPPVVSRQPSQPPLPADLAPKTPVCIGQLTVTALVLYPVNYLQPQNPGETEWVYVKLQYEHNPAKTTSKETINIKTPSVKGSNGESMAGEVFGVVEQKVADLLGPMLGKGLIRLDAKIRKGTGNVCLYPFYILLSYSLIFLSFLSCPYRCSFIPRKAI